MPIEVKGSIERSIPLRRFIDQVKKEFNEETRAYLADAIAEEILSGKSPVTGKNFERYSPSYAKKKGRFEPVDLLKNGDMLNSLKIEQDTRGNLVISFEDEKAEWHNKGMGKLPKRKILPAKNESFSPKIMKRITAILEEAIKDEGRKI